MFALADSGRAGDMVAHYHLYFLRDNVLVGAEHIEAEDDREAVRIAKRQGAGALVEVWNADRRVRVVASAKAA